MFANKKSILFITKNKIKIASITVGGKPLENIVADVGYTHSTLQDILLKFKKNIGDNVRILLNEDFVYTVTVSMPKETLIDKESVREKAQELIPENLAETVWDFKEIIKKQMVTIQVVAVIQSLFIEVSRAVEGAGLHVEAIEPLSYALARFTKKQDKPFLFVYIQDQEILLTLAQKELVLATRRLLDSNINIEILNQFISFTKEKLNIEPKSMIFCGNTKNITLRQFENKNFEAQIQNINPIISLAHKEDVAGKDEEVLNLELMKIQSAKGEAKQTNNNTRSNLSGKKPIYIIPIILGIAMVFLILGGLAIYKNMSLKRETKPLKVITPFPTTTSAPIPFASPSAEINGSLYTITILNGSGKIGEATRLESLLKQNGLNVVKTGNADSYNYEETEVRSKDKVPKELLSLVDKSLKTVYAPIIENKLEENSDTDIVIVIGRGVK